MFKKIYDHLKSEGFNVYSIGQHVGLCYNPYVVIKENSRQPMLTSLAYDVIDVIVFYPMGKYSEVRLFLDSVTASLKALPWLKSTSEITPIIIDDSVKAYTTSIKYQNYKRRDV